MRVGVYVDAFNLYYGARDWCGKGQPGWRWLDIIGLAESLIAERRNWAGAEITRVVYCTALRDKRGDPSSLIDQQVYLAALRKDQRFHIELGQYVHKNSTGALLIAHGSRKLPADARVLDVPKWLSHEVYVEPDDSRQILVSVRTFEEKGSDVNVASHLLLDISEGRIDAAVVMTNDGDLAFALRAARLGAPLGLVNPTKRPTVRLLLEETAINSLHWWRKLGASDFTSNQLPNPNLGVHRPNNW